MPNNINIALQPLTKSTAFRYGTWDVEASNWWDLQVIGCFDGEDYYQFRKPEDFINHILRWEYRDWRWFAHFGGRYDLNFIFDLVRKREDWKVSFYCSGSMVLQMSLRKGDCHAKLCDSFRLLPASLRDLTVAFDVKHQKTKYDFANMSYSKELLEYNEQDCRGLYEVLESFFEQTGMMSETFATHSLRVWRKDFLKQPIWKPHKYVTDFIRRSYHGGRVEVYKKHSSELNCYDVNSMYPYVMLSDLPMQYIAESKELRNDHLGFVHARVRVPDCYIPILSIQQEKLYFPTGTLESVWTSEELIAAEQAGCKIQRIFKGYYFRCEPILKEFIWKLYQTKKYAEEPQRSIAKYLMNSFYGKFGQNPTKKVYITESEAPHDAWPILNKDGSIGRFAYYERVSNAAYLLPHIASAVTSRARLHLYKQLSGTTYYCDTDSVFTTEIMPTSKEIGEWSFVGQGECNFYQPKLYKFNGIWKSKGLEQQCTCGHKHKDKCLMCGCEQFQDVKIDAYIRGDINTVIRRKSIKEAMRDGETACMDITIEKKLRETRPKRAWINDQETRPWDIKELSSIRKKNLR